MKYAVWIVQVLLALVFLSSGFMKLTQPLDALALQLAWVGDTPGWLVRFIGVAELLGAIGLIVPAATRIRPELTPLAALGLVVVMALAIIVHLVRGEMLFAFGPLVLLLLAAFVVYARRRTLPFRSGATAPTATH